MGDFATRKKGSRSPTEQQYRRKRDDIVGRVRDLRNGGSDVPGGAIATMKNSMATGAISNKKTKMREIYIKCELGN